MTYSNKSGSKGMLLQIAVIATLILSTHAVANNVDVPNHVRSGIEELLKKDTFFPDDSEDIHLRSYVKLSGKRTTIHRVCGVINTRTRNQNGENSVPFMGNWYEEDGKRFGSVSIYKSMKYDYVKSRVCD